MTKTDKFDSADRNTILAALRFYQQKGQGDPANRSDDIHDIATNGGADVSLDADAIDDLCERVNFGMLENEPETDEATTLTTKLPPDPDETNEARAEWAKTAIDAFQLATGTDDEDALADLLCDLMHFCDRNEETHGKFADALYRAKSNYAAETMPIAK